MTGSWTSAKGDTTGVVLGSLEGGACLAAAGPCCCSALGLHMFARAKVKHVQGAVMQLVAGPELADKASVDIWQDPLHSARARLPWLLLVRAWLSCTSCCPSRQAWRK